MSHLDQGWAELSRGAVQGAVYDSPERHPHPKCLKGTRVDLLNYIYELSDKREKSQLIWLHGTAGVGKSAVAFTVAERMRGLKATEQTNVEKRLAGTFFFSRINTNRRTTRHFFATLAYQLASNFTVIRKYLNDAIRENPALLDPNSSLRNQMEALFLRPLRKLHDRLLGCPPLSFVVDALDECTSAAELAELISLIGEALRDPDLPMLHILLTSRSESHIQEAMQEEEVHPLVCEIPVKTSGDGGIISLDSADVDNDICIFLEHSFGKLRGRHPDFPQPSRDQLVQLASRAGRRFIVASTIMKFIDDGYNDPRGRLQIILRLTSALLPATEVYKLYDSILSTCSNPNRAYLHLSIVVALVDPLPVSQMSKLLGPGQGIDVETTLMQLRSIMDIPTDSSLPVNIYHSSVRDYVSDPSNCSLPDVQRITPHSLLSLSCFQLMMHDIPERTALLDVLSELKRLSKIMRSDHPRNLTKSLAFTVQPLEPLQVFTTLLWLRGDRGSASQCWLETLYGRAWLQNHVGREWLKTHEGEEWLQTQGGQGWLEAQGGRHWLKYGWWLMKTDGGSNWLQTRSGQDWLQTNPGQSWLNDNGKKWLGFWRGESWLQTEGGQSWLGSTKWLETQSGQDLLETQSGQDWLETRSGKDWLQTEVGRHWLRIQTEPDWLQTQSGEDWLQTQRGKDWLKSRHGEHWLQTQRGDHWLQTQGGKDWLKGSCEKPWLRIQGGDWWLQTQGGERWLQTQGGEDWLQTQDGKDWLKNWCGEFWLQTQGGKHWLQTQGGAHWLQTYGGGEWLEDYFGNEWLATQVGEHWLQTQGGAHWLQTQGGKDWLQTWRADKWLQTQGGEHWLQTQSEEDWLQTWPQKDWPQTQHTEDWLRTWHGAHWLRTQRGEHWLRTQRGEHWLRTKHGEHWLETKDGKSWLLGSSGQDWLGTRSGVEWRRTNDMRKWLETEGGRAWLETQEGRNWLETQGGRDWLGVKENDEVGRSSVGAIAWLRDKGRHSWLQTLGGQSWLQTEDGQEWLSLEYNDWLATEGGQDWLQTQAGLGWLQTEVAQDWVSGYSSIKCQDSWLQSEGGRSWLQTQNGRGWLQSERNSGKFWLMESGTDWLQTQAGQDWLQTQAGQDWGQDDYMWSWLNEKKGVDWLQTQSGRDWLRTQGVRDWLPTERGQAWLKTRDGEDWLQTQSGKDWLQTPHGQAWPLMAVWMTVAEFSSTAAALSEYTVNSELPLLPAFQVIQHCKSLPDFLMFPVFLAFRHQDDSAAAPPQDRFPDTEIIRTMQTFVNFTNESRERSQSASDALKYACQNWTVHLARAPHPWHPMLNHIFASFWNHNLLPWLEMQWCLKGLRSCLTILSEGEELTEYLCPPYSDVTSEIHQSEA